MLICCAISLKELPLHVVTDNEMLHFMQKCMATQQDKYN